MNNLFYTLANAVIGGMAGWLMTKGMITEGMILFGVIIMLIISKAIE